MSANKSFSTETSERYSRALFEVSQDSDDLDKVEEEIIFKGEIGRIRDIQVHPVSGKIYFLNENGLWLMKKS